MQLVVAFANHTPAADKAWTKAILAENNDIDTCMRRFGFRYPHTAALARQRPAWVDAYGLAYETTTVTEAQRRGLGIRAGITQSAGSRTPRYARAYFNSLSPSQHARWGKLFSASRITQVTIGIGPPTLIGASGCLADARRQVYGSIQAAGRDMVLLNIAYYLAHNWEATAEWRAGDRAWSNCMRRFRYRVHSMSELVSQVEKSYTVHGKPSVTSPGIAAERRAAIATAKCERTTDVIAEHVAAESATIARLPHSDLALLEEAAANARTVGTKSPA